MRKFIVLFLMPLLSFGVIAQTKNVNVNNFWFSYAYRALPTKPLDPMYFNYAVKINATSIVKNNVQIEEIANALNIRGQVKTENFADASVLLELSLGNIHISSSNVDERKEESKDKEGKVTSTRYYYSAIVNYTYESSYRVVQGDKTLMESAIYSSSNTLTYKTSEYGTRKEAADYWNNNREMLVSGFYRDLIFKSADVATNRASSAYGFPSYSNVRDVIKTMSEKKHNENTTLREVTASLKNELQAMTPNIPLNREKIGDIIAYYKNLPVKYADPKSKADQHIRYIAYYNLCKIYYFLDEPENVAQYADLITSNGYDHKDGEKLKKAANELMAAFDRTGIHSRHFIPKNSSDLDDFSVLEDFSSNDESDSNSDDSSDDDK